MPLRARLSAKRARPVDRLELARASLRLDGGQLTAHLYDNQSSGAATGLAHSDGLAFRARGDGAIDAGAFVDFVRWGDL
jgi:molybdopterin biosynthesis enzyme